MLYPSNESKSCDDNSLRSEEGNKQRGKSRRVSFQSDVTTFTIPSFENAEAAKLWYHPEDYERFRWAESERENKLREEKIISTFCERSESCFGELSIELEMLSLPSEEELYGYGFASISRDDEFNDSLKAMN